MTGLSIGIDVGTTSVKALAMTSEGRPVEVASHRHGISERPGVVEADPRSWWESTVEALHALAGRLDGGLVGTETVGLSGNMSSVVLVDHDRRPLRPAPLLADTRGVDQLDRLPSHIAEHIVATTHNHPAVVFSLATLLWLAEEEPDTLAQADVWLSAKDYVRLRLTDTIGTEPTDAYNSLAMRADTSEWNIPLIDDLQLPSRLFPAVSASSAIVGTVTAGAAEATGLPAGVPVIAGMGDMAAAALGATDPRPDTLIVSLGTSVTAISPLEDRHFADDWVGKLTYHPLPDGQAFALASLLTGGLAVNWLRDLVGEEPLAEVSGIPDPDDPLLFLPHLSGSGTPDFVPQMRGTFFGLHPSTTAASLAQALYEAIAFELADVVEILGAARVERLVVTGGGTHLEGWVRVLTDVLGRPTLRLRSPDASAAGAARLAWQATGVDCPVDVSAVAEQTPRTQHGEAWSRRHAAYRRARATARDYYAPSAGKENDRDPDRSR